MTGTDRLVLKDYPHHIMRKTRKGEPVFNNESDYRHCLNQIQILKKRYNVQLHAWALLPDRLHLVATASQHPDDLSTFMKAVSCRISLRRRSLYQQRSVWEARYRASPVEPGQWLLASMCYVERLPALEGLAASAYHYPHSSYRMRLGKNTPYWLDDADEYARLGDCVEERAAAFKTYMRDGLDEKEMELIRTALFRNRLTGSHRFVEEVREKFNILVLNRGPGRPRKRRDGDKR